MKLPVLQRNISNRALAWLCVAVLLVSLMPLYALSFYNHACYDDFGFSLLTRAAWQETGSVLATVGAAVDNTKGIRNTWEGTYATSFISALQPALFGENLYWVSTLVLLTFFLFALWFFLRQVLVVVLHVDKPTFRMALCIAREDNHIDNTILYFLIKVNISLEKSAVINPFQCDSKKKNDKIFES